MWEGPVAAWFLSSLAHLFFLWAKHVGMGRWSWRRMYVSVCWRLSPQLLADNVAAEHSTTGQVQVPRYLVLAMCHAWQLAGTYSYSEYLFAARFLSCGHAVGCADG